MGITVDVFELVDEIGVKIERIFHPDGFDGTIEQYKWLLEHYGVTEEDDVRYILICNYYTEDADELDDDQLEDIDDNIKFLDDEESVCDFLTDLLKKYRSNTLIFPPNPPVR